eukprot:15473181-Alexandrium_andersonii.AAC.1
MGGGQHAKTTMLLSLNTTSEKRARKDMIHTVPTQRMLRARKCTTKQGIENTVLLCVSAARTPPHQGMFPLNDLPAGPPGSQAG